MTDVLTAPTMKSQLIHHRRTPPSGDWRTPTSFRHYNRSVRMLGNNDDEAFAENRRAAEQGMHDAILAMGWFYLNGVGVKADEEQAAWWYRKSARFGEPMAMFSLGYIAYTKADFSKALSWFTRAIEKGHQRSKYWFAKMLWRGEGIPQDRKRARSILSEAASKKVIEAQRVVRFLGYLSQQQKAPNC